jgi:putative photosynthetic complex assembly protein 2
MLLDIAFVIGLWFFSTGGLLWLVQLDRSTHPASVFLLAILCGPAMCGIIVSAHETGDAAAYLAFASALIIWGWHEASFLMGFVGGPRRLPATPGIGGFARFREATAAVIYHEVALAVTVVALFAITWGQPNQVAAHCFAVLFAMRLAAKLNIFAGVPNIDTNMMPAHLDYLKSYFAKRQMNALFPFLLAGMIALCVWLYANAHPLVFVLTVIGTLENVALMLPLRDSLLWQWAMPKAQILADSRRKAAGNQGQE